MRLPCTRDAHFEKVGFGRARRVREGLWSDFWSPLGPLLATPGARRRGKREVKKGAFFGVGFLGILDPTRTPLGPPFGAKRGSGGGVKKRVIFLSNRALGVGGRGAIPRGGGACLAPLFEILCLL